MKNGYFSTYDPAAGKGVWGNGGFHVSINLNKVSNLIFSLIDVL